jgi:hypothetical protein
MPSPILPRVFSARGRTYRVSIAPLERSGGRGVDPRIKAVVFEADGRVWSAPVPHTVLLAALSDEQLTELLERALGYN